MRLVRFAIIELVGDAGEWRQFGMDHGFVHVSAISSWERGGTGGTTHLLVSAEVPLSEHPSLNDDGRVIVPDAPRREAESAIEAAADLLSLATAHARRLRSPRLTVAFHCESDDERQRLEGSAGIEGFDSAVGVGRFASTIGEQELEQLDDREDGVALLAEALAQDHLSGRYREFLRLFERAFSESADRLIPPLADFLGARSGLAYTKTEVKRWIRRLRPRSVHADRHDPLLEADHAPVIDRMELAAYDVLLNKAAWRDPSTERRDLWSPIAGPLDADLTKTFLLQSSAPTIEAQLFDQFGAYVLDLSAPGFEVEADFWPRRGPDRMTAPQEFEVVPAERVKADIER